MIIDVIFLVLMVLAIFKGFSKGLIVAVFSFLAFVIGIAAALKLSAVVATYLQEATSISGSWLPVLSFLLVFIGVVLLVRVGASLIKKAVGLVLLGWADTLGGIILYVLLYLFLFSVVLFYASNIGLVSTGMQQASKTYAHIQPIGPKVINALGAVIPWFSNLFGDLSAFFDEAATERQ